MSEIPSEVLEEMFTDVKPAEKGYIGFKTCILCGAKHQPLHYLKLQVIDGKDKLARQQGHICEDCNKRLSETIMDSMRQVNLRSLEAEYREASERYDAAHKYAGKKNEERLRARKDLLNALMPGDKIFLRAHTGMLVKVYFPPVLVEFVLYDPIGIITYKFNGKEYECADYDFAGLAGNE